MHRKKVDNRIRILIENGVAERQRSLFVVVGDRGKDQVRPGGHLLTGSVSFPKESACYRPSGGSAHNDIKVPLPGFL